MDEPIVLVCSLADAPLTVPGSSFARTCSKCGRRVMIAPSGQTFLLEHPEAVIACMGCCNLSDMSEVRIAKGVREEIFGRLLPNTWGRRN